MEWLLLAGAALLIWGVVLYNRLVSDSHRVKQAWSDISVQLKLRHDLIPKLIAADVMANDVNGTANFCD